MPAVASLAALLVLGVTGLVAQPPDDSTPDDVTEATSAGRTKGRTDTTAADTTTDPTAPDGSRPDDSTATTSGGGRQKIPQGPVQATQVMVDIPEDLSDNTAVQLLGSQDGRDHVLIGNRRADGAPWTPAVWRSSDGVTWTDAPVPATPDEATRLTLSDGVWEGDVLHVGGNERIASGPTAAVWHTTDGVNFDPVAELPAGEQQSGIDAMAVSGRGVIAGGWIEGATDGSFIALRSPDGTWQQAVVPEAETFEIVGMVASGDTVVVTGYDEARVPAVATAMYSIDGGLTFQLGNTDALRGTQSSYLGDAVAVPNGYAAPACVPGPNGLITAIARSTDGVTWSRQDIAITGDESALSDLSLDDAGCDHISAEGDLLHVGVFDIDAWIVTVRPDGTATGYALPHEAGVIPNGPPLVFPTVQGLIGIGQSSGGFTGVRVTDRASATGLPRPHALLDSVDVTETGDGLLVRVNLFPEVIEYPDGAYEWQGFGSWYTSDGTAVTPSEAVPRPIRRVFATPFGDIGLGYAADPADDPNPGPNDGTEGFLRVAGGAWESIGLVATGPGGDILDDLTTTSTTAVAVGTAATRGDDNRPAWAPLVRSTVDGRTWTPESIPLAPGAFGGLEATCTLGDVVIATGWKLENGVRSDLVALRDAAGAWSIATPTGVPEGTAISGCVSDGSRVITYGTGRDLLLASTDGVAFEPVSMEVGGADDASVTDITPVDGGFVAVGWTVDATDQDAAAAVWASVDGLEWSLLDVPGLDDVGDQYLDSITARADGSIAVSGQDDGNPVLWTIAASALDLS